MCKSMCKYKRVKEKKIINSKIHVQNIFSLKKINSDFYFDPVILDFNSLPYAQEDPLTKYYPYYLKDNQAFTPSFISPLFGPFDISKMALDKLNIEEEKQKQENEVLMTAPQPQPGLFCRVCGVCRQQYDRYFQHVNSEGHQRWLRQSIYQKYIKKFCRRYSNNNSIQQKIRSLEESENMIVISESQIELDQTCQQGE